ncbi:UDP-glucose 4-epimerase GalE [Neobacillus pocheonensis]|uniref:UDP-glucose 4-epimerase GalE n=1 Tax=Neobacillus pocheonensis TaxID=363869 RepID=UPI003D2D4BFB
MILVTGGAGYIGSHVVKELIEQGFEVVVVDNLFTGRQGSVAPDLPFFEGDIGNETVLDKVFTSFPIKAVMHLAASCLVAESVEKPLEYYQNNVSNSAVLLKMMMKHRVDKLIFSSTCATYGIPHSRYLSENSPLNPVNPYGQSKLMFEKMIEDCSNKSGLSYIILRYFNVGGADLSGEIGEDHDPETHLIPNILRHLMGKTDSIKVFGHDFQTPDGTCVRDYIHVLDVANAHIVSLKALLNSNGCKNIYNLGSKKGYSVMEIIRKCETVTGKKAAIAFCDRRPGDPPYLVASAKKIEEELNWKPVYSLEDIISTAWKWHNNHPDGYQDYGLRQGGKDV